MNEIVMVGTSATPGARSFQFTGAEAPAVGDLVARYVEAQGFRLEQGDRAAGEWRRGRQRFRVVVAADGDVVNVELTSGASDWWSGLWGAPKSRRRFESLCANLPAAVMEH